MHPWLRPPPCYNSSFTLPPLHMEPIWQWMPTLLCWEKKVWANQVKTVKAAFFVFPCVCCTWWCCVPCAALTVRLLTRRFIGEYGDIRKCPVSTCTADFSTLQAITVIIILPGRIRLQPQFGGGREGNHSEYLGLALFGGNRQTLSPWHLLV